ncbi:unnamed protein product [Diamesa serratosioi]
MLTSAVECSDARRNMSIPISALCKNNNTVIVLLIAVPRLRAQSKWKSPSVFDDEPKSCDCEHAKIVPDQSREGLTAKELKAAVYYRRVLLFLFRKETFIKDPSSSTDHFVRNIALKISEEQLEILGNPLTIQEMNVIELDDLLSQVVVQSQEKWDYPLRTLLLDLYRKELLDALPNWNSPTVMIPVGLLLLFLCVRKMNFSNLRLSAIIIFLLMFACVISYGMSYMDCIYELEVEQMMSLSLDANNNNPCRDYHRESESRFGFISTIVFGSAEHKCREHMKKTLKPSKRYCDPLDVGIKWIAQVQMGYLGVIVRKFKDLISEFTASTGFFQGLVYTIVGWLVLTYIVLMCLKSALKHGIAGMFGFFSRSAKQAPISNENQNLDMKELKCKIEDLLYENKLIKRELSSQNVTLEQIRESSVERTFERIEASQVPSILPSIGEDEMEDQRHDES